MEKSPSPSSAPVARQHFFAPQRHPFLELRTTLDSGLPYAEHFHSAFSLGLILQGKTRFWLNGSSHLTEEGDLVLIAPGRAHSCNPVDGPRGYHMLLIDADWLRGLVPDCLAACAPCIRDAALFRRAADMVAAVLRRQEAAVALLEALLRDLHACHSQPGLSTSISPQDFFLTDKGTGLDANPETGEKPPSVTLLARKAGVRRDSFSRAVRKNTGLPPSRYLHCLRLEKGRRLLRQGTSISEAALAAGYADQSHFHRMFLRFYAVTPGRYRRSLSHPFKN